MIISDAHRLVFVHIPKCAGTAIRSQLQMIDSCHGRFSGKGNDLLLGSIDYSHLPLVILQDRFPEEFEKLCAYRSFAIVRDPHTRFLSAALQHLQEFEHIASEMFEAEWVVSEILRIAEKLGSGAHERPEFVHFTRQTAFVDIEGRRVVQHLFEFENMAPLAPFLRREFGIAIDFEQRLNKSPVPDRAPLEAMRRAIGPGYRRMLPRRVRNRVHRAIGVARIINTPAALYEKLLRRAEVREFIDDYYACDVALHRSVADARAAAG